MRPGLGLPGAAISGIGLGLLMLTATVVFGASLTHLIATPHLWGATWQARVGDAFAPDVGGKVQSGLAADPWVHDLAAGTAAPLQLNGRVRVDAFAMNSVRGRLAPLVLAGRAPAAANEILVGTASLRSLGGHIGDQITVSVGPASARMRIVGRGPDSPRSVSRRRPQRLDHRRRLPGPGTERPNRTSTWWTGLPGRLRPRPAPTWPRIIPVSASSRMNCRPTSPTSAGRNGSP